MENKAKRGFALLPPERRSEISSAAGKAAHRLGQTHRFTRAEAQAAGRKGGLAISANRQYMSEIGRKGGAARAANRVLQGGQDDG